MPEAILERAYGVLRKRLRLRRGLEAAAIAACVAAMGALAGLQPGHIAGIAAATWPLAYLGLGLRSVHRRISPAVFAEHLDRRLPALEESSRLMLADAGQLAPLQRLQRARVARVLAPALADRRDWLPPATNAATLVVLVAASLLILLAAPIRSSVMASSQSSEKSAPLANADEALIASTEVRIEPPDYTGIEARVTDSLDIEVPEGSTVTWQLRFRRPGDFALMIGDEQRIPLSSGPDDSYVAKARIDRTSLYRFVENIGGSERALAGVNTLTVALDKPPRVRIVDPDETALEIERGQAPRFDSRVEVRDDFGLAHVEIRASVAKGSGEGVKFRDQTFEFDTQSTSEASASSSRSYTRAWDLKTLGMEPGDEVYFFVVARDNRDPEPNESRSDTVVVRWLDETPEVVTVGDLAIDVMPEYYKSQRQIIIETEQLIADRDMLDDDAFSSTSRSLGVAQAALKTRYGQYLGDEFDDSLDGEFDVPAPGDTPEPEAADATRDEHAGHDDGDHQHAELPGADRPGSAEALMARFVHSHDAADIGPVSARNPVGLMKRAVAKMWQSELHLRLSEPAAALPHQYEALEYYNRAREAERIFTRRLGFEPPPVSEDRRLTGDIGDVGGDRLEEDRAGTDSDDELFRDLHDRLTTRSPAQPFGPDELELLARAANRLQQLSANRPALIRRAAQLEQLRLAGAPTDDNCKDCVAEAVRAAWSALSSPQAKPVLGARPVAADDALIRDYAGLEPAVE